MKANYHTHTVRCNHAQGSEREYIESAINAGFSVLGFSDHIPYDYPDGFVDMCKMEMSQAQDYFETLLKLKEEYKDKIEILIGFEAEYYEELFDKNMETLSKYPIDYLILGQHQYPSYHGKSSFSETDSVKDLADYVDVTVKAIETDKFVCVAHPDVINFTGDKQIYKEQMRRICIAAKDHNAALEINMQGAGSVGKRRHYPNEDFFKVAAEVGNSVIIGSDAHSPSKMFVKSAYDECMRILNNCGITPIDFLNINTQGR